MAKGNLFLSQARGKVGSVVFTVLKGQQIARVYNARPANPRSSGQQAQRSLLANMTKYYKRATSNFYKFAYENKTVRESDYNAFARENTQRGVYMPRDLYDSPFAPALGRYIISRGSLATNIQDYFSGENYGVLFVGTSAPTTVGALSTYILTQSPNLAEGDIFTMVMADSSMEADMSLGSYSPDWQIIQFKLDPSDLRSLATVGLTAYHSVLMDHEWLVGVQIAGVDRASFGAVVISRQTPTGLLVSDTEIKCSATANVLIDWMRGEFMRRTAAVSWGANPDAVLQGSLIETLPDVTLVGIGSGDEVAAYAYNEGYLGEAGTAAADIILKGSNLRTTDQGGKCVVKIYPADVLTDGLITKPIIEKELTMSGTASALQGRFSEETDLPFQQGYLLIEYDGVPVWYGQVIHGS